MVMVERPGPPFVRLTDSSNSCSVPLIDMIAVMTMVGRRSGTVIRKKDCVGDAPSIFAAS